MYWYSFYDVQLSSALCSRRQTTWPYGVKGTRGVGSATAAAVTSRAPGATACGAHTRPRARQRRRGAKRCPVVNVSTSTNYPSAVFKFDCVMYLLLNFSLLRFPFLGVTCPMPQGDGRTTAHCSGPLDALQPGSTCSFTCEPGFEVLWAPVIACTEEGSWNASVPTCRGAIFLKS